MFTYNLSYSAFELYQQCPFKYYQVYILKNREPANEYALYGVVIHSVLEQMYEKQEFTRTFALNLFSSLLDSESRKKNYKKLSQKILQDLEVRGREDLLAFFLLAEREDLFGPCISQEQMLTGKFRSCRLRAKLDLVRSIKGGIGILDWKTGKPDRKNLLQLALYAVLYTKLKKQRVDWLVLVYLKTCEIHYIPFDATITQEAGKYFGDIYNGLIQDTQFSPKKNKYCNYCSFRHTACPLNKVIL